MDLAGVHAMTSFADIKDIHARTSLQSPCLKGSSQWPQRPCTSWQSPSEDLARSIFHKKKMDISVFQQGSFIMTIVLDIAFHQGLPSLAIAIGLPFLAGHPGLNQISLSYI